MQAAKNATASVKDTASNFVDSSRSGMEKIKATAQEKVEKMTAHDQVEKQRATEKKQEKIHHAELGKQEARKHNAASKQTATSTGRMAPTPTGSTMTFSTTGPPRPPIRRQPDLRP